MKFCFFIFFALFVDGLCIGTEEVQSSDGSDVGGCSTCGGPKGVKVKYYQNGSPYFYDVPLQLVDALSLTWRLLGPAPGAYIGLQLCCPADLTVCALYDAYGNIAGIQIAILERNLLGLVLDLDILGFRRWTPGIPGIGDLGNTYWCIQQYFISQATINLGIDIHLGLDIGLNLFVEGSLWLDSINNQLINVDVNIGVGGTGLFTKQGCLPDVGQCYFYNLNRQTQCNSQSLSPWFLIENKGNLIGTGLAIVAEASLSVSSGTRNWFELATVGEIELLVPYGPQCFYNLARNPGFLLAYIYYELPEDIDCGSS